MRATTVVLLVLSAGLSACGGSSARAAWPDVASTDRSAEELGLPIAEEPSSESGTGTGSGSESVTSTDGGAQS
jgi:hypothetical protein